MYTLSNSDVHVWQGLREDFESQLTQLEAVLSEEERARRDRFRFLLQRKTYTIGRGLLKTLLGRYLDIDARQLKLDYGEHGKPCLPPNQNPGGLSFNLSHSESALVYAITRLPAVGVDVEYVKRPVDIETVSRRVLSARELERLLLVDGVQRRELFFRYWTQKEAYLKGLGLGLAGGMAGVEVEISDAEGLGTLRCPGKDNRQRVWTIRRVDSLTDYAAAVAVAAGEPLFHTFSLSALRPL